MSSTSTTPITADSTSNEDTTSIDRIDEIIKRFSLVELESESGLIHVIDRSLLEVSLSSPTSERRLLRAQNHIYYMLTTRRSDKPHLAYNYLHSLENADDLHILVEGDSVDYYLFYNDGHVEHKILGHDYVSGEVPVVTTPGTIASKALRLRSGKNGYAFIVSIVTPEWTPDRCRIGAGQSFVDNYIEKEEWCSEAFLKELIGPNWINDS